jgi:hypothetical protein
VSRPTPTPGWTLNDPTPTPSPGFVLDNSPSEIPLRQSINAAADKDPDRHAKVLELAQRTGMSTDIVERNFDAIKKHAETASTPYAQMLRETPHLADWLSHPDNAAIAKDDHPRLGKIEKLLDVGKSFVKGGVETPGSGLAGMGDLNDVASRAMQRVLHLPQWTNVPIPWWLNPSEILKRPGQVIEQQAQKLQLPPEHQTAFTEIAEGLGQLVPLAAAGAVAGPEAVTAIFAGQGAHGAKQKAEQAGKAGTPAGDTAEASEAAVNALLGEMGFESIMNRIPKAIRGPLLRRVADIATSAGIQGVTQAGIQLATNVADKLTLNPNQPLTQDLVKQALLGGAVGGIARGVLGVALPDLADHLRKIDQAKQSATVLEQLGQAVTESKTFQRLPEGLQKLILSATKDQAHENVYVSEESIRDYAQSLNQDAGDWLESITPGGKDKLQRANGADIEIPLADYATKILPTEAAKHFNELVRPGDPEAYNLRDAKEYEAALKTEAAHPEPRPSELQQSAAKVREDITGQLTGMGLMPSAVDAYARLYEHAFHALGERSGRDPFSIYEPYRLKITRPLPEILRSLPDVNTQLDPLIDQLRTGKIPTQGDMFGKPLLDFIRELGGVQDEGGDLASREIDKERKPFQKRLVNPEGVPLDKAREAAAEAGYLDKQSSIADFLAAVDKEARGEPVYAQGQENPQAIEQSIVLEQLQSYLKSRDVDLSKMNNAEVRELLQDAAKSGNDIDARTGTVLTQELASEFGLEKRGRILFGDNRHFNIELLDKADLVDVPPRNGTLLPRGVRRPRRRAAHAAGRINPHAATDGRQDYDRTSSKTWAFHSRDKIGTEQHEQFARSFEAYLREGKAPSPEMRSIFRRFADG